MDTVKKSVPERERRGYNTVTLWGRFGEVRDDKVDTIHADDFGTMHT